MTSSTVSDRAKCSPWSLSQGLVVTLWDTRSERYLRFPSTQRIHSWTSVQELKSKVTEELGYPAASQRLYMCNQELEEHLEMKDLASSLCLDPFQMSQLDITVAHRTQLVSFAPQDQDLSDQQQAPPSSIQSFGTLAVPESIKQSMQQVQASFSLGHCPTLSEEGTSGAYLLMEANQAEKQTPVAVWKPIDEEPFAPNNPRGMQAPFGSETCRPGVKSGESSLREVLAYLLDHEGFAGVPPTALVELSHPSLSQCQFRADQVVSEEFRNLISGLLAFKKPGKNSNLLKVRSPTSSPQSSLSTISSPSTCPSDTPNSASFIDEVQSEGKVGSFQLFVQSLGPIENYSPSLFPTDEVHKIAVLDLRLLNLDRNACNILVRKESESGALKLVPIDHGLTIPDSLAIQSFDLAWLDFPQALEPFSTRTLDYIKKLDIETDIKFIEKNFKVRPECLRNIKITSLLLKQAAARGLTLAQIGQILCRPDDDENALSLLETIVGKAQLCADLRLTQQRKFQDSMLSIVPPPFTTKNEVIASSEQTLAGEESKKGEGLKRMPKNNSFNAKDNSAIQKAMLASLAPDLADDHNQDSPFFKRGRGMTEGTDEHQIHLFNENTNGMIRHKADKLQRQCSLKKQLSFLTDQSLIAPILDRQVSQGEQAAPLKHIVQNLQKALTSDCGEETVNGIDLNMRRATSYNEATQNSERQVCEDLADYLVVPSTTINGKHRRLVQAQQAWIKYQISEYASSSTNHSFKQHRQKAQARKLLAKGGPHDTEFFRCFTIYLSEALKQFSQTPMAPPTNDYTGRTGSL